MRFPSTPMATTAGNFEVLYRQHAREIKTIVRRYAKDSGVYDYDDLFQDFWLKIAQTNYEYQEGKFINYSCSVIRNLAADFYRRQKGIYLPIDETTIKSEQKKTGCLETLILQQYVDCFDAALKKLSDQEYLTLYDQFIEKTPLKERAKAVSKSALAVKMQRFHARKKFMKELSQQSELAGLPIIIDSSLVGEYISAAVEKYHSDLTTVAPLKSTVLGP